MFNNKLSVWFNWGQLPEKITLMRALEIAADNYPSIKAKEAIQHSSEYHLKSIKDEYIPDLYIQDQDLYSTANNVNGAYFSNGGTAIPISGTLKTFSNQPVWSSFGTLLFNWSFFNFGKVRADVNVAKNELKRSVYDYDNELFQFKIRVADAYLLLIALEQLESVEEQNYSRASSFYQMTYAYSKSGMKAGVDSSVARAELSQADLLLLQSKKNVKVQKYNLMSLMGINKEFITDTSGFISVIPAIEYPDTGKLLNNPLLQLYSINIDVFQSRAKDIKLSYLPSIHLLGAGWARGSGIKEVNNNYVLNSGFSEGVPFEAYNYMLGVSFVWNLTSFHKIYSEYKSESFLANAAEFNYNEAYIISKEQLNQANLEFQNALEEVKESPIQYRAALDAYKQSKSRYDAGLSTYYEIAQALYILNRAEADQLAAYNNLWRALLKQAAAAGDLNIFTSNIK